MADPLISSVDEVACRFEPRPWAFAAERREAIEAHWRRLVAGKPQLFNGEVLILHRLSLERRRFDGAFLKTDYASFLAWRDFGFPDPSVRNCFAMAALQSVEGHFVLGEMARHTANGGAVYFAAGTPDPADIIGDTVDLEANLLRELEEETGLTAADLVFEDGWTVVQHGLRVALMRRLRSRLASRALGARIEAFLAAAQAPELAGIRIVATGKDIDASRMPIFQQAYLRHALADRT